MDCRTEEHVRIIGNRLGTIMDVEANGITWDAPARLKISLDVTKQLCRILEDS